MIPVETRRGAQSIKECHKVPPNELISRASVVWRWIDEKLGNEIPNSPREETSTILELAIAGCILGESKRPLAAEYFYSQLEAPDRIYAWHSSVEIIRRKGIKGKILSRLLIRGGPNRDDGGDTFELMMFYLGPKSIGSKVDVLVRVSNFPGLARSLSVKLDTTDWENPGKPNISKTINAEFKGDTPKSAPIFFF